MGIIRKIKRYNKVTKSLEINKGYPFQMKDPFRDSGI